MKLLKFTIVAIAMVSIVLTSDAPSRGGFLEVLSSTASTALTVHVGTAPAKPIPGGLSGGLGASARIVSATAAPLLSASSKALAISVNPGQTVTLTCAEQASVVSGSETWTVATLDVLLTNDFRRGSFMAQSLAFRVYPVGQPPRGKFVPFMAWADNTGSATNQVSVERSVPNHAWNASYCIDLRLTVPPYVSPGDYYSTMSWELFKSTIFHGHPTPTPTATPTPSPSPTPTPVPTPTPTPTVTYYHVPSAATGITIGSDGNQWMGAGAVILKSDASGNITSYSIPWSGPDATDITAGAAGTALAGTLWAADANQNGVDEITTSGSITSYSIPYRSTSGAGALPSGVAIGADGNIWICDRYFNAIWKMTPSGSVTEYPVPTANAGLMRITAGPDGNLWFTEESVGRIGKITTTGAITEYSGATNPYGITGGPDGRVWFTDQGTNAIGAITSSGTLAEYPIPTSNASPIGITSNADGSLYFTEGLKIGKITITGTISEVSLPSPPANPFGITSNGGQLWFTMPGADTIGTVRAW